MKNFNINIVLFAIALTLLTSCSAIEGIFKAGMGFGIFIVVAIVVLILYFMMRGKK